MAGMPTARELRAAPPRVLRDLIVHGHPVAPAEFPSNLGVNPQIAIMALADLCADRVARA